jgi:hypothetical protein
MAGTTSESIEKQSNKSGRGGKREGAGRPLGVPNKLSATVKDNIITVFDDIGGIEQMSAWAKENKTQFYNMYAKLLPLQVTGEGGGPLTVEIVRFADQAPE